MQTIPWRTLTPFFLLSVMFVAGASAEEVEDDLAPSKLSGAEAKALLKAGMTSDDVHRHLLTTPAMVREKRFHWQLSDGSLWTDFVITPQGARIIGWIIESESAQGRGGEAYELDLVLSQYYLKQEPESVLRIVELAGLVGMLDADYSRRSFSTFLAEVFRANPEKVSSWLASAQVKSLNDTQRQAIYAAISQAQLAKSQELLESFGESDRANRDFIRTLLQKKPQVLLDREIATPDDLDELWSAFFATGDRRYVERICTTFSWEVSGLDRSSPRWLVNGAAAWSVGSNATRHPIVLDVCKANEATADAFAKPIYEKILKDVEAKGQQPQ